MPLCTIYTISIKYVCLSLFANGRSKFLLDRLSRFLKLFGSTVGHFSQECASQFGLDNFLLSEKHPKTIAEPSRRASVLLNEPASDLSKRGGNCITVDRSPATCRNADTLNGDNCGHGVDRLSQNDDKAKTQNGDNESVHIHYMENFV